MSVDSSQHQLLSNIIFTGAYRPDIHKQYGSNSALKMGQESDLDSVISSDVSVFGHDQQALR